MTSERTSSGKKSTTRASAASPQKPSDEAKPGAKRRSPSSFAQDLRELAAKHRGQLVRLAKAETKLEEELVAVRAQRRAIEAPLRELDALLGRRQEEGAVSADEEGEEEGAPEASETHT